ncbi:thiamine pyrophosphate-binding protein [Bifidobacterium favimelis]|uniref:Thiamine pyrophosphate-binding protein n=1 Tax=Bifidobacterium favimelis TaxID=3122979 RepID=A0ABU8ZQ16_9BIFI
MKIDVENQCRRQESQGHGDPRIDNIFGLTGNSVDTMVEALYRERDKVKFTQVRHEEVAALTAAAHVKPTGKVCIYLSIGGARAIHMLTIPR